MSDDYDNSVGFQSESEPQIPYTPNPEAAKLIATLIQTGYFPSSIPECMTGYWPLALAEIQEVADKEERDRFQSFSTFTTDLPQVQSWGMMNEVRDLLMPMVTRTQKDRQLFWAKEAMSPPPKLSWIVDGLFARPSFNLLVGDPGSKKTYLAMDLATCVANDKPWLGFAVSHCPVFFVDEETGYIQMWNRFNSVLHAHDSEWGAPLAYTSIAGYNLRHPADAEELIRRALSIKAGLIIIDALPDLMPSSDGSSTSMQPVLFNLRRMAETCNAAVVVIHHNNREGGYRGSSSISASVDLMLSVSSQSNDTLIEIRCLKARFQAPEPFCARAHFETTAQGEPRVHLTATDDRPEDSQSPLEPAPAFSGVALAILGFLTAHPNSTRAQMTEGLSAFAEGTIRNVLHQLIVSGQVKKSESSANTKSPEYTLVQLAKNSEREGSDV